MLGARPDVVRLVVTDSGIGIPQRDHDRVLDRSFRSDAANERALQGSGLGCPSSGPSPKAKGGSVSAGPPPTKE